MKSAAEFLVKYPSLAGYSAGKDIPPHAYIDAVCLLATMKKLKYGDLRGPKDPFMAVSRRLAAVLNA